MFPHHEDEIAQSEAANGCKFVNYWLHCAHLIVDGEKMSKSLGNFYTLRDILDKGYTGREIRWVLLGTHYRQPLNFSFRALEDARASLHRLDDFRQRLTDAATMDDNGVAEATTRVQETELAFRNALEDDLNISAALAALFDLVRDTNRELDRQALGGRAAGLVLGALDAIDSVLAVMTPDDSERVPADVQAMADERQQARKDKDYARADALRDKLADLGWIVEDTPKGPRVKRQ
jgi:cysteinyl-tRNA synthetase